MSETQIDRLMNALRSADWLTLPELYAKTNDPIASISANIRNLRKPEHGSREIKRRRRRGNLFEYHLVGDEPIESNGDDQ